MNFLKITSILALTISTAHISAQKYEPIILEKGKTNNEKKTSEKEEKLRYFLQFGIMSKNHDKFKEKYGVNVVYENCVITTYMSDKAKKNNREVARYLTEKYGENWKKDLEITPFGL